MFFAPPLKSAACRISLSLVRQFIPLQVVSKGCWPRRRGNFSHFPCRMFSYLRTLGGPKVRGFQALRLAHLLLLLLSLIITIDFYWVSKISIRYALLKVRHLTLLFKLDFQRLVYSCLFFRRLCIINTYLNCFFSPQVQEFLYFFLRPFSSTRFRGGRHFESTQLHACAVALWHARYGHKTCSRQGWTFTHLMKPATCRFPSLPRLFFQNRTTSERGPKTEK